MRTVPFTAALILLAALAPAPANAASPWDDPLLAAPSGPGAGWATISVSTDGSSLLLGVEAADHDWPMVLMGKVYDPTGALVVSEVVGRTARVAGTYAAAAGVVVADSYSGVEDRDNCGTCTTGLALPLIDPAPGRYTVVLVAAGEMASWSALVRGGSGVTVHDVHSGPDAFLFTTDDFAGAADAQAATSGVGAHGHVASSVSVDIGSHLIGMFAYGVDDDAAPSAAILGAETPDGTSVCPCNWDGIDGASGTVGSSGTYTMSITGVGPHALALGEPVFVGADVVIP